MKAVLLSTLASLMFAAPSLAEPYHRHAYRHHAHDRGGEAGMPITAQGGSIRINAVGEVISQPAPLIDKERKFDSRAKQDLTKAPNGAQPAQGPAKP